MITTVTTSKGTFTIIDVPKGATVVYVTSNGDLIAFIDNEPYFTGFFVPGNYSLIGADPLNLTEDEWGQVVESINPIGNKICYRDFQGHLEEWLDTGDWYDTAELSGHSLLTASGHTPGECVVLKLIN